MSKQEHVDLSSLLLDLDSVDIQSHNESSINNVTPSAATAVIVNSEINQRARVEVAEGANVELMHHGAIEDGTIGNETIGSGAIKSGIRTETDAIGTVANETKGDRFSMQAGFVPLSESSLGKHATPLDDNLDAFIEIFQRKKLLQRNKFESQDTEYIEFSCASKINDVLQSKYFNSRCGNPLFLRTSRNYILVAMSLGFVIVFKISTFEVECILGNMKSDMIGIPVSSLDIWEGNINDSSDRMDAIALVGYRNGKVILWNIKTAKPIYELKDIFQLEGRNNDISLSSLHIMHVNFLFDGRHFLVTNEDGDCKICKLGKGTLYGNNVIIEKFENGASNVVPLLDMQLVNYYQKFKIERMEDGMIKESELLKEKLTLLATASATETKIFKMNSRLEYIQLQSLPEHISLFSQETFDSEEAPYVCFLKDLKYSKINFHQSPKILRLAIGRRNKVEVRHHVVKSQDTSQAYPDDYYELSITYILDEKLDEHVIGLVWIEAGVLGIFTSSTSQGNDSFGPRTIYKFYIVDPTDERVKNLESYSKKSDYVTRDNLNFVLQDKVAYITSPEICVDSITLPDSIGRHILSSSRTDGIKLHHNKHIQISGNVIYVLHSCREISTIRIKTWRERLLSSKNNWDDWFQKAMSFYNGSCGSVFGLPKKMEERESQLRSEIIPQLLIYIEAFLKEYTQDMESTSSHTLHTATQNFISSCLNINSPEIIFQQIYPLFINNGLQEVFISVILNFFALGKLTLITKEFLSDLFQYSANLDKVALKECLRNIDLSQSDITDQIISFSQGSPEYFDIYIHIISNIRNDFQTGFSFLISQLLSCEPSEQTDILSNLCSLLELTLDKDVETKRSVLHHIFFENKDYPKILCATTSSAHRILNLVLDILLDKIEDGVLWNNSLERSEFVMKIWKALDEDKFVKRCSNNSLYQFKYIEGSSSQIEGMALSNISMEVYIFLAILFVNSVIEITPSQNELIERLFIYLIKRHSSIETFHHPRITNLELLLKELLNRINLESNQHTIFQDKYSKLIALAKSHGLNALIVSFYQSEGKIRDALLTFLDRIQEKDAHPNSEALQNDVKLIMEFYDHSNFVYDELVRRKAHSNSNLDKFFQEFLIGIWDNAKNRSDLSGRSISDELYSHRKIIVNKDFLSMYLKQIVALGDDQRVIQFLEDQIELDIDECLAICDSLPDVKSYLYAQKGDIRLFLNSIISNLEEKKMRLLVQLCAYAPRVERQIFERVCNYVSKSNWNCQPTPVEEFDLQYYRLICSFESKMSRKPMKQDMPFAKTMTLLREPAIRDTLEDHAQNLKMILQPYKDPQDFDFGSIVGGKYPHVSDIPLEAQNYNLQLQLPEVILDSMEKFQLLDLPEYKLLKTSMITSIEKYLSYLQASKMLEDDIQGMAFRILDEPFLSYLKTLRCGFIFEDPESPISKPEKLRKSSSHVSFDSDSDSDSEAEENTIPGLKSEINECSERIESLKHDLQCCALDEVNAIKRELDQNNRIIIALRSKLIELEAEARIEENIRKQKEEDPFTPTNMNKLANLWYQHCISDCIETILQIFVRYIDVPTVIQKIANSHLKEDFQIRRILVKLFDMFTFQNTLLNCRVNLHSKNLMKVGKRSLTLGKQVIALGSQIIECSHCRKNVKTSSVDDIDIAYFSCGHAFHSSCIGNSPCTACHSKKEIDVIIRESLFRKNFISSFHKRGFDWDDVYKRMESVESILDSLPNYRFQSDILGEDSPRNIADQALVNLGDNIGFFPPIDRNLELKAPRFKVKFV